jgi:hypothetical protein
MSTPAIDIKRLIKNLGRFHPQMVAEKMTPNKRLQKLPGGEECIDWTCPYQTGHQLPLKLMLLPSA